MEFRDMPFYEECPDLRHVACDGRPLVLLAEPDEELRDELRAALVEEGYDAIVVEDGFEVLDVLTAARMRRIPLDLAILSSELAESCLEIVEEARENGWPVSFVIIDWDDDLWLHERAGALGAHVFLPAGEGLDLEPFLDFVSCVSAVEAG